MIKRIVHLWYRLFNDNNEKQFIKHNIEVFSSLKINSEKKILVEFTPLQHCVLSWSYIANILASQKNASIYTYGPVEKIPSLSLMKIYKSFNVQGYISEKISKEEYKEVYKDAINIYHTLNNKKQLQQLKYKKYGIGQDVYETYLINGHPTVDLNDQKLFNFLLQAMIKVHYWDRYFGTNDVSAVIVSHDCYLGNIIRRVANKYNVDVYQVTTSWGVKLFEGYNSGTNFKYYHKLYEQLSPQKQNSIKEWAKKQLARRFSGEVGVDMSYSHKSSFGPVSDIKVLKKTNNIKVLICTHCFFDNPYAYGTNILFTDFYEWLVFLGEMSNKTEYDWYLKCHPDYRPGTKETLQRIISMYPKIKMLPETVPHQQLIEEGIRYVFTVYGTVGCEYPLLGAQVINAGNNPHIAYDFNWHPKTIKEYENMILNLPNIRKKINIEDVYEFYGIHHQYAMYASKNRAKDDLLFYSEQDMMSKLGKLVYSSKMYKYFLDEFDDNRHQDIVNNFKQLLKRMNDYRDDVLVKEWI